MPRHAERTRGTGRSGAEEDRTPNLGIANAALSQLSYRPMGMGIIRGNSADRDGMARERGCPAGGRERHRVMGKLKTCPHVG